MSELRNIYQSFEDRLSVFLDTPHWKWRIIGIGILLMLLSFFNNFSPLRHFTEYFQAIRENREFFLYQTIKDRALSFTTDWRYPEFTGMNNRTFRLFLPAVVRVLHLKHISIVLYAFQLLLGGLFYYLLTNFLYKILQDKLSVFYTLIGLACLYVGTAFFIDNATYGDFFSFFFLFLCLYLKNPALIFGFMSLALWNDERSIVGAGMVILWWWLASQLQEKERFRIKINGQIIAVSLAIIAYWGVRKFYLTDHLGMHSTYKEGEFQAMFSGSWAVYGFKFFWVLEGFWGIILLSFLFLLRSKDYGRFVFIAGLLFAALTTSMVTFDSTRSSSFSYPVVFLCLVIIKDHLTVKELRIITFLVALFCFLHPMATRTDGTGFFLM